MYVDCHTKRQVYIKMRKFIMFITAVCVLFLIKGKNTQYRRQDVEVTEGGKLSSIIRSQVWYRFRYNFEEKSDAAFSSQFLIARIFFSILLV